MMILQRRPAHPAKLFDWRSSRGDSGCRRARNCARVLNYRLRQMARPIHVFIECNVRPWAVLRGATQRIPLQNGDAPFMSPVIAILQPLDPADWISHHPAAALWVGGSCLWVSVSLVIRMWVRHPKASFVKKLLWSCGLLVPFFGWLFYAGLFHVPGCTDVECPDEHSRDVDVAGTAIDP